MSATRIKGAEGVIIESNYFLELPKALTKETTSAERAGMIRYNAGWKAFEGVLEFEDGSMNYRRFANLDENGQLLTSQLPDSITSGAQYIGTYSPISDDIDPPLGAGIYNKLPAPVTSNSGKYYIVRGLYDAALAHFNANSPTTSTVTFTPTNPSGQGNWIQIKYYIGVDPINPSTDKIVTSAFGRIISASIPSTNHEGLVSLATDSTLTAAFTSSTDRNSELALTDGDWIISTGTVQQRLRQNRVSISAGAVSFDRTFSTISNRSFSSSAGTVQTVIDNLILDGLRRTGDSMYDDGSVGSGRLGIVYGSAVEPSIAFNSNSFDSDTNPGTDPSKWSDTTTGIFHPATGSIGFSSSGVEKLRISPSQLTLYPVTGTAAAPNILFSNTGNTALGLNVTSNRIDFVSNSAVNVSLSQGVSTFNGNVNITGTITVGSGTTSVIQKNTSELRFNMTNFDDVSVYDGTTLRTKFNRYGVQLPVLNPIDNSVGVNGMIAYSSSLNAVIQKSNGVWSAVGSGGAGVVTTFTTASWVLSGSNYTYTITSPNIQNVQVQELSGSNYSPVQVDSIVISSTNAVLSVPASPDLRFAGRVIVQNS